MSRTVMPSILAAALLGTLATSGCGRTEAPADATAAAPAAAATAPAATPAPDMPAPATAAASEARAGIAGVGDNGIAGELTFVADGDGARITGKLTGLAPGSVHGLHVHDTGDCSDPAGGSAGKHFNPAQQQHGGPEAAARHAGDLPNATADADGTASIDARVAGLSVGTRDEHDVVGRAVIVHEKQDDYTTQPSGGAGTPVACGVVALPEAAAATDAPPTTP
jgi:Cu-Zn family superoxide dismutase